MDLAEHTYTFTETDLSVGGMPLRAGGTVELTTTGTLLDLFFSGSGTDVERAIANLPRSWQSGITAYSPSGSLDFTGTLKGIASASEKPEIRADFQVDNGDFVHRESGVTLGDFSAAGVLMLPATGKPHVTVGRMSADFEGGRIAAQGSVTGFKSPHLNLHLDGDLELNDLRKFAELEQLKVMEGRCSISADFEGSLPTDRALVRSDLNHFTSSGKVSFSDAAVQLSGSPHLFEGLEGKFRLNNLDATVEHLHGALEDSDFTVSGGVEQLTALRTLPRQTSDRRTTHKHPTRFRRAAYPR